MEYPEVHIGQEIEQRMGERGITQKQLANACGIAESNFRRRILESTDISTKDLMVISKVMGFDFFVFYRSDIYRDSYMTAYAGNNTNNGVQVRTNIGSMTNNFSGCPEEGEEKKVEKKTVKEVDVLHERIAGLEPLLHAKDILIDSLQSQLALMKENVEYHRKEAEMWKKKRTSKKQQ